MKALADLPITDYYKRSAEGLPEIESLLDRLSFAVQDDANIEPIVRGDERIPDIRRKILQWRLDKRVISALGTAAAIISVEQGQLFESVTHRQFDGHNVRNLIHGVFSSHCLLVSGSPVKQEVKTLYRQIHQYFDTFKHRSSEAS